MLPHLHQPHLASNYNHQRLFNLNSPYTLTASPESQQHCLRTSKHLLHARRLLRTTLYPSTNSIAFFDLAMDSCFPASYRPSEPSCVGDWLQPAYLDSSSLDDDFLISPTEVALDASTYVEPNQLEWTNHYPDFELGRYLSLSSARSVTPDLCTDRDFFPSNDSLPQTPVDCKRDSLELQPQEQPEHPVKRKRGRPKIVRNNCVQSDSKPNSRASKRLPHNQVERKYREGLNAELDRLRLAIPTMPHEHEHDMSSPPKPSKATVLGSAIEYIHRMEAERNQLRQENEALRAGKPVPAATSIDGGLRD